MGWFDQAIARVQAKGGDPNNPTPTEQAGLANAAKNRAAAAAGVAPGPSIAVTRNDGTGVPVSSPQVQPRNQQGGGSGDYGAFGRAWLASGGKTPAELAAFVKANPQYGAEIFGTKGNKVRIGGRSFDMIYATSDPARARGSFDDITNASANDDPRLHDGIKGNARGGAGGGSIADFAVTPWTQQFKAPTQEEAFNDEGFKFTLARGQEALERSHAARGTSLTTGLVKELQERNHALGSQQYDKVYGRRMNEYETQYRNFTGNEQARFSAHNSNFGNNMAVNQNQFYQGLATNQNAFSQQFSLANLGMNAANSAAMNSGNYANNAGNLYTQQGNVNAAGQVGSANAWNQGLGTLANLGSYYANPDFYRRPPLPSTQLGPGYAY